MRPYRTYTDEQIIEYASQVTSIAQLLTKLGLRPAGGNYASIKRHLQRLNVNTDHWTGQAWSKGEQLKDWSDYKRAKNSKRHLIKIRGHRCESCQLEEWIEKPIALEIHHVDGDRTNNDEKNLLLLCPNCHAMTDTWRGRNKK